MTTQPKQAQVHTPLPWVSAPSSISNQYVIGNEDWTKTVALVDSGNGDSCKANAALIVKAVNCHEELLAAVKNMYSAIDNGHSLALTHVEYKELINKAEGK